MMYSRDNYPYYKYKITQFYYFFNNKKSFYNTKYLRNMNTSKLNYYLWIDIAEKLKFYFWNGLQPIYRVRN